jgi:hypothetical protein
MGTKARCPGQLDHTQSQRTVTQITLGRLSRRSLSRKIAVELLCVIQDAFPAQHRTSDGSLKDLNQVMDLYIGAGNSNPNLGEEIHVLDSLTGQERSDLLAFLNSLTGETPPNVGPPEIPKRRAQK